MKLFTKRKEERHKTWLASFLSYIIRHKPVTILMSFLTILILGSVAILKIPLQLFPSGFQSPILWVDISAPSASSKENERTIAKQVEPYLSTLKNIEKLTTTSSPHNVSFGIQYIDGTNMDYAFTALRDKLDRVYPRLPEDTKRPTVYKFNTNEMPVLFYSISVPPFLSSLETLFDDLKTDLESVDGVGKVSFHGNYKTQVNIDLQLNKLRQLHITPEQVYDRLKDANLKVSMGKAQFGSREFFVRGVNNLTSLNDIRNIIIDPQRGIQLKTIAHIRQLKTREIQAIRNVDGKKSYMLSIVKESMANTIDTCRLADQKLQEILAQYNSKQYPLKSIKIFSQADRILNSLMDIVKAALMGGTISFLILLLFIKDFFSTFMISMSIPFSLFITIMVQYLIGEDLNVLSMLGLMICIGMVIDNSIVVMESIYKKREHKMAHKDAAIKGLLGVSLPIFMATSTTIVVFLPMIFVKKGSIFSWFMLKLGVPVCMALLASLLIALIFIPTGAARLMWGKIRPNKLVQQINLKYQKILVRAIRWRKTVFILFILLFATIYFPIKNVRKSSSGLHSRSRIRIEVTFSRGSTFAGRNTILHQIEKYLISRKGKYGVRHVRLRLRSRSRIASFTMYKDPNNKAKKIDKWMQQQEEIIKQLREQFAKPGVKIGKVYQTSSDEEGIIQVAIVGDGSDQLEQIANDVKERLRHIRGVLDVQTETDLSNEYEQVYYPDRTKLFELGINSASIAKSIRFYLSPYQVGYLEKGDKNFPIYLGVPEDHIQSISDLSSIEIQSKRNNYPLGILGDFQLEKTQRKIVRVNRKNQLDIQITVSEENLDLLYNDIQKNLREYHFPPGYSLDLGDKYQQTEENQKDMIFVVVLSVTLVFLLMGVLFESFILPLLIIFTVPMAFVGAFWFLYIGQLALGPMSYLALVILVGIVVNNAIILIDSINNNRKKGFAVSRSVLKSCVVRFRPIIMTALTTISGLLPMATLGSSGMGVDYQPLGIAVIGGLVSATLFTLFFIPIQYLLLRDIKQLGRKYYVNLTF